MSNPIKALRESESKGRKCLIRAKLLRKSDSKGRKCDAKRLDLLTRDRHVHYDGCGGDHRDNATGGSTLIEEAETTPLMAFVVLDFDYYSSY